MDPRKKIETNDGVDNEYYSSQNIKMYQNQKNQFISNYYNNQPQNKDFKKFPTNNQNENYKNFNILPNSDLNVNLLIKIRK